jgi:hypothetical protein
MPWNEGSPPKDRQFLALAMAETNRDAPTIHRRAQALALEVRFLALAAFSLCFKFVERVVNRFFRAS